MSSCRDSSVLGLGREGQPLGFLIWCGHTGAWNCAQPQTVAEWTAKKEDREPKKEEKIVVLDSEESPEKKRKQGLTGTSFHASLLLPSVSAARMRRQVSMAFCASNQELMTFLSLNTLPISGEDQGPTSSLMYHLWRMPWSRENTGDRNKSSLFSYERELARELKK